MELLRKEQCMLDILDRPCNSLDIRRKLVPLIGKEIIIKNNLGRNKYEIFKGVIVNVYNSVFIISVEDSLKSFSFADVVTKIIKIYC